MKRESEKLNMRWNVTKNMKRRHRRENVKIAIPFWKQTTSFTCDPACLLMAMKYFDKNVSLSQQHEFELWRESYGIGIPGCLPQGLAYSALKRGFMARLVCLNKQINRVGKICRGEDAKVTRSTAKELLKKATQLGADYMDCIPTIHDIKTALDDGWVVLVMIHMRRLHRIDSPHWILVCGYDKGHVLIHDPYAQQGFSRLTNARFIAIMQDLGRLLDFPARALFIKK